MTDAATGLARALARGASKANNVSDLTKGELLGQLNDHQKTDLAARLRDGAAARGAGSGAGAADASVKARLKSDPHFAAGFREASDRAAAVLAHPEAFGRYEAAAKLLEHETLDASDIIGLLADMQKPDGFDAIARAMGGTAGPERYLSRPEASAGWKRAVAQVNAERSPAGARAAA